MPPAPSHSALGWKIALGLIMLLQGVLTTIGFKTFEAVSELQTAKAENSVMVNSVILPTLTRHDTAIEQLKNRAGVANHP